MENKKLIKMPSISQFRNVVAQVNKDAEYNNTKPEIIEFTGTIKTHGTNASVCLNDREDFWAQSKGNIITPEKDNAAFAFFAHQREDHFRKHLNVLLIGLRTSEVCLYGEWIGRGIQKGVGVSEMDKTFIPFGIKYRVEDTIVDGVKTPNYEWVKNDDLHILEIFNTQDERIRSVYDFLTFRVSIDFNDPDDIKNKMDYMIQLTGKIKTKCPVAGYYGIDGIGEGIVWVSADHNHSFKVKGEKHSKSRVKTLKPKTESDLQRDKDIIEFANYACPAWRLEQMYQETFDTLNGGKGSVKGTGDFLRNLHKDIMKEEQDEMAKRSLEPKDVNSTISKLARTWFMEELDREAGP